MTPTKGKSPARRRPQKKKATPSDSESSGSDKSTTSLQVKVTASDGSGAPLDQQLDIAVHTEVNEDELDLSTTLDPDTATTESYALKVQYTVLQFALVTIN